MVTRCTAAKSGVRKPGNVPVSALKDAPLPYLQIVRSSVSTTRSTLLPPTTTAGSAKALTIRGGVGSYAISKRWAGEIRPVLALQRTLSWSEGLGTGKPLTKLVKFAFSKRKGCFVSKMFAALTRSVKLKSAAPHLQVLAGTCVLMARSKRGV